MILRFQCRGEIFEIRLERAAEGCRAWIAGKAYEVEVMDDQPGMISLRFAGRPATIYWAADGTRKWLSMKGCTYLLEKPAPAAAARAGEHMADRILRSPMPAQVRAIEVTSGDTVVKGQTLLLLEAMKMEIRLQANRSGRVTVLNVVPGQTVNRDQELLVIE